MAQVGETKIACTPFEERSVAGRVAVITGGSRGIGLHVAQELHRRGVRVFISARDQASLDAAAATMPASSTDEEPKRHAAVAIACNVATDAKSLFAKVEEVLGTDVGVDILVLAAGNMTGLGMPPPAVEDDVDLECIATNCTGAVLSCKHALPLMLKPGTNDPSTFARTIVFLTSCEGWLSTPTDANGMLAYRASKAAVNGCMVALHQLYGTGEMMATMVRGGGEEMRIPRIISVHPGYVQTALGIEDARLMEPDLTHAEHAERKTAEDGFVPVAEGADTIVWAICAAADIESGKCYFERKVHPF